MHREEVEHILYEQKEQSMSNGNKSLDDEY
jgi:hypothetical protein